MSTKTFINLPVKNLPKTIEFFTSLGFSFNEQFGDESTACMVISEDSYAMLHIEASFKGFIEGQEIADTAKVREVLIGLSADTREQVDTLVDNAVAAGGQSLGDADDQGFMYMRAFRDLDGHQWSSIYMDMSAIPEQ